MQAIDFCFYYYRDVDIFLEMIFCAKSLWFPVKKLHVLYHKL